MENKTIYNGKPIFQNQPSYKLFNKSFENPDDTLFCMLNDVDPDILKKELEAPSQVFTSYLSTFPRKDPRTQEVVRRKVYDHTIQKLKYTFPSHQLRSSVLNRAQQATCLRVLLAFQRNENVDKKDFAVWFGTSVKRGKEQKLFHKYIYEYANTQKEQLYAPMKSLVLQYCKWYKSRMQHILRKLPNISYATCTGLPQLHEFTGKSVETARIENVQLLCRTGQVRLWPEVRLKQQELSTLRVRLERYACIDDTAKAASQSQCMYKPEKQLQESDVFVLPLDALLMLLAPGAYVDLPREMLLKIRETTDSDYKYIEFEQPLPASDCGWHTNSLIVAQAYAAYAPTQWLQFNPEGDVQLVNDVPPTNDDGDDKMQHTPEYKLHPIDFSQHIKPAKTNSALVSWRLCTDNPPDSGPEPGLLINSCVSISAVRDVLAKQPLGCHFIKLENKPECGSEIMTKYELLSAWLQLKLLQTDVGHCTRISLRDFDLLLEEQLTTKGIEQQLHEHYRISMPQQLCQLHAFLKLILHSVSPGEYLLRYAAKYSSKFLLCRPTEELSKNSFKLQDLLTAMPPSDVSFLTDDSFLPISDKLCSRMHEEQQLLPCAFRAEKNADLPDMNKPTDVNKPAPGQLKRKFKKKKTQWNTKEATKKRKQVAAKAAAKALQKQDTKQDKTMLQ